MEKQEKENKQEKPQREDNNEEGIHCLREKERLTQRYSCYKCSFKYLYNKLFKFNFYYTIFFLGYLGHLIT